jgi:hypothetical protein
MLSNDGCRMMVVVSKRREGSRHVRSKLILS